MTPHPALVAMRQRDLHRYHTLRLVLEHRLTGTQAAASLDLSERHVWWLLARLRAHGHRALVHGNRGRPSGRRLPESTQAQILTLAQGQYAGLNTTHLTEKLQAEHGLPVSRATAPGARGRPRRAYSSSGMAAPTPGWRTGGPPAAWSEPWTMPPGRSSPGPPSCPRKIP